MLQAARSMISTTADGWTVDTTKAGFLGVTAHWIQVKKDKWEMRSEVIGFRAISGDHSGKNLGRYFVGVCDRIGIINMERSKVSSGAVNTQVLSDRKSSQLLTATLDNASSNTTKCETIQSIHERRKLPVWSAEENQLP